MGQKVARGGLLVALAFVFGYLESLVPISVGIPGIKLGIAKLVVLFALYKADIPTAITVSLVRAVLGGFTFGTPTMILYSLAGSALSLALMLLCKKCHVFSPVGISIVGGVAHNIGQSIVAAILLSPAAVLAYLPLLLIAGAVTGAIIGGIALILIRRI